MYQRNEKNFFRKRNLGTILGDANVLQQLLNFQLVDYSPELLYDNSTDAVFHAA